MICSISNLEITPFGYSQGYGFVNPTTGTYVNTATLTGTFVFDVSEARDSIDSLGGSKQFSLKLELTTTAPSSITYDGFLFTGFTNSPVYKLTSTTSATYNITLTNAEYALDTISCGFSITLTYSGSLSNFPSLSSATYTIVITPDEVIS